MNLDRRKLINFIEIYIFSAKGCLVKTTDAKKEDLQLTLQDECSSASSVVWSAAASNFGKLICPFTTQNIYLSLLCKNINKAKMDAHLRKRKSKKALINQGFIFNRIIPDIKSYTENPLSQISLKNCKLWLFFFQIPN